jgi:hypothetical protein
MDNKFTALLKSRKFWAAIIGLMAVFLGDRAGVGQTELAEAILLIVAYIMGVAVESRVRN